MWKQLFRLLCQEVLGFGKLPSYLITVLLTFCRKITGRVVIRSWWELTLKPLKVIFHWLVLSSKNGICSKKWLVFKENNKAKIKNHLGELHDIHAFRRVPVEESSPSEHGRKLVSKSFECFLYGGTVIKKGGGGFLSFGWYITHSCFHVIRNPIDKWSRICVLHCGDGFLYVPHSELASEHSCSGKVPSLARITGYHHVLRSEHVTSKFRDAVWSVALRVSADEWCVGGNEEMKSWKRNHIYCEFSKVCV